MGKDLQDKTSKDEVLRYNLIRSEEENLSVRVSLFLTKRNVPLGQGVRGISFSSYGFESPSAVSSRVRTP